MDKIEATGVIVQTIYSDTGNVMYIVNVELNGNIVKAQSIYYSILDENIVPCKSDLAGELRILALFGIMVIVVICIFIIKNN